MESLTKIGINFMPKETIKNEKTEGLIETHYARLSRVVPQVLKEIYNLLENKF